MGCKMRGVEQDGGLRGGEQLGNIAPWAPQSRCWILALDSMALLEHHPITKRLQV